MRKTIGMIGGSGFVGKALARQAVRAGYKVRVACRHPHKARSMLVDGVSLHQADICSGKGLDDAVAGCDVVINLVGLLYERGRYSFDATHVQGTRHVLDVCERHGVSRYLHMSALGAAADSESAYGKTKFAAEEVVRNSTCQWTIMRPSVIFGQGDSFFTKLDRLTALAPVFPVIAADSRLQPVWVEDVCRAFLACISDDNTIGQTYTLAGPKTYSMLELVELVLQIRGRQCLCFPLPDTVAGIMASFARFLPKPPLTPDQLAMLKRDNIAEGDESFPACFGTPASVEAILPTYLAGSQAARLQQRLDQGREHYRRS